MSKILNTERCHYLAALMQLPPHLLMTSATALSLNWEIKSVALPQSGLGLLKIQDSAFHEPFFLGEIPVSSAHISVRVNNGSAVEGAAMMMTDNKAVVESLALFDAVLTHELEGYSDVLLLVADGERLKSEQAQKRNLILAKTRVDFSLLDNTSDDNED